MDAEVRTLIQKIIDGHRIMSLATIRPDGWPQATTVGYAKDGMILYFLCGADSQKAKNLAACNKVSLTIDEDAREMLGIKGLSMAAHAAFVVDRAMESRIFRLLMSRYPEVGEMPEPDPATVRYVRLTPKVISVLDYSKGFGHTDLVAPTPDELTAA
jgi:nitroimidazol reductase NimA-like FMN-containing flavoprotein (pyridoxamine 5'-phosphate oxidase superfamily)